MSEITAYPLAWPIGWRRMPAHQRRRAKFSKRAHGEYSWGGSYTRQSDLSVNDATRRVLAELERMRVLADDIVISTNLVLRLDGLPRSGQAQPADPGACVYWITRGGENRCMAIDRYDRVADNIAAIAATLDAMRAIERHGGAEILDRAFTGFTALPNPEQWFQVLGFETSRVSADEIQERYRRLARQNHPDRGGDTRAMGRINRAREDGLRAVAAP